MTSDRARKKAARAQQAATGQPYMQAWRSVQRQPGTPAEPVPPPPIEPETHAVHRQQWGDRTHYVVQYQDGYYTWLTNWRPASSVGTRCTIGLAPRLALVSQV